MLQSYKYNVIFKKLHSLPFGYTDWNIESKSITAVDDFKMEYGIKSMSDNLLFSLEIIISSDLDIPPSLNIICTGVVFTKYLSRMYVHRQE